MNKVILLSMALGLGGALQAATHYLWLGGEGDYNDTAMWDGGVVPDGKASCADLSKSVDGAGIAYIREGMTITNGFMNVARTNDFTVIQTGGEVVLNDTTGEGDHALKIGRGDTVNGMTVRPTGTYTITGGRFTIPGSWMTIGVSGTGVMNVDGGEVWCSGRCTLGVNASSLGTLNVTAGKISALSFYLGTGGGTILLNGGTLAESSQTCGVGSFVWGNANAGTSKFLLGANGGTIEVVGVERYLELPIESVEGTAGTLTKTGSGILWLKSASTYTGATVVEGGTLIVPKPENLPGWDVAGKVTVKEGARIQLGPDWTDAQVATFQANVVRDGNAAPPDRVIFDTTSGDREIPSDLNYPAGFTKIGSNTLTLSGRNTFGSEQRIEVGTLRADFGEGLDASQPVVLAGGALASISGTIDAPLGTGAGQISAAPGCSLAFAAKGVATTVDLGGAGAMLTVTNAAAFPNRTLTLNSGEADSPIAFVNALDITGCANSDSSAFKINVVKNDATINGEIRDRVFTTGSGYTMQKNGAGSLTLTGAIQAWRFTVNAGNVNFANPGSEQLKFGYLNLKGGGYFTATNQNIKTSDNCNVVSKGVTFVDSIFNPNGLHNNGGQLLLKNCTTTVADKFWVGSGAIQGGYSEQLVVVDGGTIWVKGSSAEGDAPGSAKASLNTVAGAKGHLVLTNNASMYVQNAALNIGFNAATPGTFDIYDSVITSKWMRCTSGTINQHGGYVRTTQGEANMKLGMSGCTCNWFLDSGAEFDGSNAIRFGTAVGSVGRVFVNDGNFHCVNGFSLGYAASATGVVSVAKGVAKSTNGSIYVGNEGDGFVDVYGEGTINSKNQLLVPNNKTNAGGTLWLAQGGTVEAPNIVGKASPAAGHRSAFLFHGGTLKPTGNSSTFVNNVAEFKVGMGGGIVDSDGKDITFVTPLVSTMASAPVLLHRWSFNGDLIDSVTGEGVDASKGCSYEACGNGQAVKLTGGNSYSSSYLELGSNILPTDGSPMMLEFWARLDANSNFARLFDFGSDANHFITYSLRTSSDNDNFQIRCGTQASQKSSHSGAMSPNDLGVWYHFVILVQPVPDGEGWQAIAYRHNLATGETQTHILPAPAGWTLSSLTASKTYLGRSQSTNDKAASITYDEVRIWKGAFTADDAKACALMGPDTLPSTVFEKRGTGTLTLSGANSYPASTKVTAGTLKLASGASLATEKLTVAPGGTVDLNGNAFAGTLEYAVDGASVGTVTTSGALDLSGISLAFAEDTELQDGCVYTLLTAQGGVSGHFAEVTGLPKSWGINYGATAVTLAKRGFTLFIR